MKKLLAIIIVGLLCFSAVPMSMFALAELPIKEWDRTYGGPNIDEAKSVIRTSDGGYAVAGSTRSFGNGNRDMWLVKTDAPGNLLWNKSARFCLLVTPKRRLLT